MGDIPAGCAFVQTPYKKNIRTLIIPLFVSEISLEIAEWIYNYVAYNLFFLLVLLKCNLFPPQYIFPSLAGVN